MFANCFASDACFNASIARAGSGSTIAVTTAPDARVLIRIM